MAKFLIFILSILFLKISCGQSFLNGSFEFNLASNDLINLDNPTFGQYVNNCKSFGTSPNLDLIKSPDYCNIIASEGNWFIAMTGGGSDAFSLKLNSNLNSGQS